MKIGKMQVVIKTWQLTADIEVQYDFICPKDFSRSFFFFFKHFGFGEFTYNLFA